jgi:hypothetical protein
MPELGDLHRAHFAETEAYVGAPFDPDYARYAQNDELGSLVIFTCRDRVTQRLVGYLQYFISRDLHSRKLVKATEDAFFLLPDSRKGLLAVKFLRYALKSLLALGVKVAGMSTKAPCGGPDLDPLLRRLKFKPVALFYYTNLGD